MQPSEQHLATAAGLSSVVPARERQLPSHPFYSVEYPGYVKPTSASLAIQNLGGQASLDAAFRRMTPKADALVELRLQPENPFAHPIPGEVVGTNNVLLKVVKRKRRSRQGASDDGLVGEYTVEAVGIIPKTLRFRGMADYQYQPDEDDPLVKLRHAIDQMDVEAIHNYTIPEEKDDYVVPIDAVPNSSASTAMDFVLDPQLSHSPDAPVPIEEPPGHLPPVTKMRSNLRLFPPPLFSRQTIPLNYNFKANNASMVSTTVDEATGEEKKRLINKMRWKGYGPATIMFADSHVPEKPPKAVESTRSQVDQAILSRLEDLFLTRPIWTRLSLFNQFSSTDSREIHNSKVLLPLVCYVFQDGPWRDTLVRFSYDPRKEVGARFYQRLYFRNPNHAITRASIITRRQDRSTGGGRPPDFGVGNEADRKRSHIFDGQKVTKETAAFQLCDIEDPMLKAMIKEADELREVCHDRDGWFLAHVFEQIKTVLRHKFFSLLEGHIASDEECRALLEPVEGSSKVPTTRTQRLRAGKHNMAKGALRPEDAAAMRLRATLEKNAKDFLTSR